MRRPLYVAALASLILVDCRKRTPSSELWVETTHEVHGGIRFEHLVIGTVDPTRALVIALHGRGSSPEGFDGVWRNLPAPLEIALPQAFEPYRTGFQWFDWPPGMTEEDFAAAASAAEEKLWPVLVEVAHGRKLVVTGHSQGAIMAYVIAARHPEIVEVIPVSGGCPHGLILSRAPARVYALHGTADNVLSVDWDRSTISELRAAGGSAELREFPGAGHGINEEMQRELFVRVAEAAGATRAR